MFRKEEDSPGPSIDPEKSKNMRLNKARVCVQTA